MADASDDHVALGKAVRQLREKQGMTQEQLATATGLQATYLSDIERAKRNPTWSTVVTIARALGTTPGKLSTLADKLGPGRK